MNPRFLQRWQYLVPCAALLLLMLSAGTVRTHAQPQKSEEKSASAVAKSDESPASPQKIDERAEKILAKALEAAGGSAFLNVQTVVSTGYYTQFKDGIAGDPARFTDYLAFPDRERTEFKSSGGRIVQVNAGERGWLFDSLTKNLTDMKPPQVKDFQVVMRASLDNLLRGWWRKENASLTYAGRREAGLAKRNEVVRLTYPDGFAVEFEFGARDGLLNKVLYKRQTGEDEEVEEEDRMAKHVSVNGVMMPFIIDHFRAGQQSNRISYETVEFNRPLDETLFARPADVKSLMKSLK